MFLPAIMRVANSVLSMNTRYARFLPQYGQTGKGHPTVDCYTVRFPSTFESRNSFVFQGLIDRLVIDDSYL